MFHLITLENLKLYVNQSETDKKKRKEEKKKTENAPYKMRTVGRKLREM